MELLTQNVVVCEKLNFRLESDLVQFPLPRFFSFVQKLLVVLVELSAFVEITFILVHGELAVQFFILSRTQDFLRKADDDPCGRQSFHNLELQSFIQLISLADLQNCEVKCFFNEILRRFVNLFIAISLRIHKLDCRSHVALKTESALHPSLGTLLAPNFDQLEVVMRVRNDSKAICVQ